MTRCRWGWAALVAVVLTVITSCSADAPAAPVVDSAVPPITRVVSYADAAEWAQRMDPVEATDQIRDWARLGLAGSLGMTAEQTLAALPDSAPLRDRAFAGLVEQPTGAGRAFVDAAGVQHLLVPDGDTHRSRTIGTLLDAQVARGGVDPLTSEVHRYRIDPATRTVTLNDEGVTATERLRADNGWFEAQVGTQAGLDDFLRRSARLAGVEKRGSELWASGWQWSDSDGARLSRDDVAVLQRGHAGAPEDGPGFSLDPVDSRDAADLRSAVPGLSAATASRVTANGYRGSAAGRELADTLEQALAFGNPGAPQLAARGLPTDRGELFALLGYLEGVGAYSRARYDGGVENTEVGHTMFYADLVAKNWVSGVGSGVPAKAVPGFVPDPVAPVPPSVCPDPSADPDESGRLWFGQNDADFRIEPGRLVMGAQTTRLYNRANGPDGREIDPSYRFGRGLQWWSDHYDTVADYEPQYRRLDELMRWSGALSWLSSHGGGQLPAATSAPAGPGGFAAWYQRHGELRERGPLNLVAAAAGTEAIRPVPSVPSPTCGGRVEVKGGVSLADLSPQAEAAPAVRRQIDPSRVTSTTGPRRDDTLLGNRIVEPGDRELAVDADEVGGTSRYRQSLVDDVIGDVEVAKNSRAASLTLRPASLAGKATVAPEYAQQPRGPPVVLKPSTALLYQLDGPYVRFRDGTVGEATETAAADAPGVMLQAATNDGAGGPPIRVTVQSSTPPSNPRSAYRVQPATQTTAARFTEADLPAGSTPIAIQDTGGRSATAWKSGNDYYVRADDALLNPAGPPEFGLIVRDLGLYESRMRDARARGTVVSVARDGELVLVTGDRIVLAERGSEIRLAADQAARSNRDVRFEVDGGGRIRIVDAGPWEGLSADRALFGDVVAAVREGDDVFLRDDMAAAASVRGPGAPVAPGGIGTISRDAEVVVRTVAAPDAQRVLPVPDTIEFLERLWSRAGAPADGTIVPGPPVSATVPNGPAEPGGPTQGPTAQNPSGAPTATTPPGSPPTPGVPSTAIPTTTSAPTTSAPTTTPPVTTTSVAPPTGSDGDGASPSRAGLVLLISPCYGDDPDPECDQ